MVIRGRFNDIIMIKAISGIIKSNTPYYYPLELSTNISTNIIQAYGVRKLRSTYSGNCIMAIKSGNTTQNIGFSGNDLNTTSLLSFSSSGDAGVYQWYNQVATGGTIFSNPNFTNNPRIVSSGSIITQNSKPTISSNLNNNQYLYRGYTNTGTSLTLISLISTSASDYRRIMTMTNTSSGDSNSTTGFIVYNRGGGINVMRNSTEQSTGGGSTSSIISVVFDGTNCTCYRNGTLISQMGYNQSFNINQLTLFSGYNGSFTDYSSSKISELYLFNTALSSTDRNLIEKNMGTYYGITVA